MLVVAIALPEESKAKMLLACPLMKFQPSDVVAMTEPLAFTERSAELRPVMAKLVVVALLIVVLPRVVLPEKVLLSVRREEDAALMVKVPPAVMLVLLM